MTALTLSAIVILAIIDKVAFSEIIKVKSTSTQTTGGFKVTIGIVPDYADLRSDIRRVLRHRGVSHSIFFAAAAIALTERDGVSWHD